MGRLSGLRTVVFAQGEVSYDAVGVDDDGAREGPSYVARIG